MDNVHVSDEAALAEEHELAGHVLCRDCGVWMEPGQVALTVLGDGGYCATCLFVPGDKVTAIDAFGREVFTVVSVRARGCTVKDVGGGLLFLSHAELQPTKDPR